MSNFLKINTTNAFIDEVHVGCNPENADMGNPDGSIFESKFFVAAVTPSGRRFIHNQAVFEEHEDTRAEAFAAKVLAAGEINLEHWNETYEVYGSSAWEESDAERAAAWQMDPNTAGTVRDF